MGQGRAGRAGVASSSPLAVVLARRPDVLAAPTLGAWRRRNGVDGAAVRRGVLWLIACEMVSELRRQAAAEEWAAIGTALERGWAPCQLARRMRRLADRLDPPGEQEVA